MRKFILAAAMLLAARGAQAGCNRLANGLNLDVPNFSDGYAVWATCINRDLNILNTQVPPIIISTQAIITGSLSVSTIAAYGSQIFISSPMVFGASATFNFPTTFKSTVTVAAQDASGYSLKLSSGLNAAAGTITANMFVGDGSHITGLVSTNNDPTKVLKAGDTMTGPLTISGSSLAVVGSSITATGSINTDTYYKTAGTIGITGTCPSGQALTSIAFNGGIVTGGICSPASAGSGGVAWLEDNFSAAVNGVRTNFVLKSTPTNSSALFVYRNGLLLESATDYIFTAPSTVDMTAAPAANSSAFFIRYSSGTPPGGSGSGDAVLAATQTWSGGNTWNGTSNFKNYVTLSNSTESITGTDAAGYSLFLSSGINMPLGTVNANFFKGNGSGLTGVTSTPSGAAGGTLTGTYPNPTIAASGVGAGTYGSGTLVPVITVGTDGRVTSLTTTAVTASDPQMMGITVKQNAAGSPATFTNGIVGAGTHLIRYLLISLPPSYYRSGGSDVVTTATEVQAEIPAFISATLKNLTCLADTAPGAGGNADSTFTFTIRKNETSTSVSCAITGASAVSCSDSSNTASVSPGDRITIQLDSFSNTNGGANRPVTANGSCFFQYAF